MFTTYLMCKIHLRQNCWPPPLLKSCNWDLDTNVFYERSDYKLGKNCNAQFHPLTPLIKNRLKRRSLMFRLKLVRSLLDYVSVSLQNAKRVKGRGIPRVRKQRKCPTFKFLKFNFVVRDHYDWKNNTLTGLSVRLHFRIK